MSHWRDRANRVIDGVLNGRNPRTMGTAERKAVRDEISKAYPFGERRMHPYKIWLSAVRIAMSTNRSESRVDTGPLFVPPESDLIAIHTFEGEGGSVL